MTQTQYTYHVFRLQDDFEMKEVFVFYYVAPNEERARNLHRYYYPDCNILGVQVLPDDGEISFLETPDYPHSEGIDHDDENPEYTVWIWDIIKHHDKEQTSRLVCTNYEG